jgi:hypothetical protein
VGYESTALTKLSYPATRLFRAHDSLDENTEVVKSTSIIITYGKRFQTKKNIAAKIAGFEGLFSVCVTIWLNLSSIIPSAHVFLPIISVIYILSETLAQALQFLGSRKREATGSQPLRLKRHLGGEYQEAN